MALADTRRDQRTPADAGAGAAPKVLTASADTPIETQVGPEAMQANPSLKGMTQGDFVAWAGRQGTRQNGGHQLEAIVNGGWAGGENVGT